MGLNIKNPEVERLIAEVAARTGETKTEAVRQAMLQRLDSLDATHDQSTRGVLLDQALSELRALLPPELIGRGVSKEEREEILGYGPDGV
ncbi:MAG: type II toxin-antitoxin system VapB family antitoxin [Fimbriimonadaceae bacterium]|jgi:antitoxin VapB|nr:type II toxin-antitoxin system VapB family antitoxin [Fimbriimonadaceae bacterium]MBZ0212606.1 type II toxin-antitoxin system VapB family antitoxin [Fimbriimonadaceae bacterium]